MASTQIKIGVRQGGGPAPGYQWNVGILEFGFREVRGILSLAQYQHLAMQIKELAKEDDPTHPAAALVKPIEGYFELCDKGGVLGKKSMRVFFGIDKGIRSIIILGGIKKETDGPTPSGTRIAMRRRWRKYSNGDYGRFSP